MAGESAREEARRAREKSERLARRAEMFEKGAEGETATAAVLAALPPGWTAIHDVRWPSRRLANIDHILVGPGGIFVIDSKNWSGTITVANGHLRQNGRSREKAVAACADAGLAIAELAGPYADRVYPVLCFVTDESLSGRCRDVMVCSSTTLRQMLMSRPSKLDPSQSTDAWFRLDMQLRAATSSSTAGGARTQTARSRRRDTWKGPRRPSARSRRVAARRKKSLIQLVFSLAVLGSFLAYGPQMSAAVGAMLAEQFTKGLTPSTACDESVVGDKPRATKQRSGVGNTGKRQRDTAQESVSSGPRAEDAVGATDPGAVTADC